MTYQQTIDYLFNSLPSFQNVGSDAYKPGLERIAQFCGEIGEVHTAYPVVHVAGTNGKGSTSHMLASVLQAAGYRVGLFTSPHLVDFRERIRIGTEMISQDEVVGFVERHRERMEALQLSFFEMTAAMAFEHFKRQRVDVAIIETGLGGRLDATNIVKPLLSIITNVGFDHVALLGDTLPLIAREKCGIIKESTPVVLGEKHDEYNDVVRECAAAKHAPLIFAQEAFSAELLAPGCYMIENLASGESFKLESDLYGIYQQNNVVTLCAAVEQLRVHFNITLSAFLHGVATVCSSTLLRGRWQVLSQSPLMVCDTGHNAHGIVYVARQIKQQSYTKLYCIIGFARDKDIDEVLPLFPKDAHYIFTRAKGARALTELELEQLAAHYGLHGESSPSVEQAVARARELANADDMIFIGGSNFIVAEL